MNEALDACQRGSVHSRVPMSDPAFRDVFSCVGGHEILSDAGRVVARWRLTERPALKFIARWGAPRRGAAPTRMSGHHSCDRRAGGASEASRGDHEHGDHEHVGSVRPGRLLRDVGQLAGWSHHTVAVYVAKRDEGRLAAGPSPDAAVAVH